MKKFNLNEFKIEPHHIVVAYTSEEDYEMSRHLLLRLDYYNYVIVEGYHCSCYDFEDAAWEAIEYTVEEIRKLAEADYNNTGDEQGFWEMVKGHIY